MTMKKPPWDIVKCPLLENYWLKLKMKVEGHIGSPQYGDKEAFICLQCPSMVCPKWTLTSKTKDLWKSVLYSFEVTWIITLYYLEMLCCWFLAFNRFGSLLASVLRSELSKSVSNFSKHGWYQNHPQKFFRLLVSSLVLGDAHLVRIV